MVATKDKEDINEAWTEPGGVAKARSRCKLQKLSQTDSEIVERNKMLGIFCIVSDIKSHNTHNALADTHTCIQV